MKKVTRSLVALSAASLLVLAGCSSDGESTTPDESGTPDTTADAGEGFDAGSVIGIALPQKTSENWVIAEDLFNEGLRDAGYEPNVQFATGGVADQQAQIDAMVNAGAKVIVVGALDGGQLGTQLEAAQAAGVKIIAYDRLLTGTDAVDLYIAYDNYQVGVLQGEALLQGLAERKGEGPYTLELIAGSNDDANSQPFFEGAMSILQPKIDDGTLVIESGQDSREQVATENWQASVVQTRMEGLVAGYYSADAPLDGILSPNDNLARAAITAVVNAGLPTPVVSGQDSEAESVISIINGEQYQTIYKDTATLVEETINQINRAQQGEAFEVNDTESYDNGVKIVPAYLLTPISVTSENVLTVYANDRTGLAEVVADNS